MSELVCQNVDKTSGDIYPLEEIARSSRFRLVKARRATKYIVLKGLVKDDSMHREMLRREFELSYTLSHPSIVTTLGFEESSPIGPAIIMEYIDGITLSEFISLTPTFESKLKVLDDILDGVEYMHHRAVLHNDLKPLNIIVTKSGSARIIDFGLSISDDSAYRGCFGGSEEFSAPEVLSGRGAVGCASDIYSLGKIISLLVGDRFSPIVERCIRPDPSMRYQSVASLRGDIKRRRCRVRRLLIAAVLPLILLLVVVPMVANLVNERVSHRCSQRVEERMQWFYKRSLDSIVECNYYEFASIYKSRYLFCYKTLIDSLSRQEVVASEYILARQIARLDSMCRSLPSINSLPLREQDSLIEKFNSMQIY